MIPDLKVDFPELKFKKSGWVSTLNEKQYAAIKVYVGGKRVTRMLHNWIMQCEPHERVVFLNGITLDCRRSNMKKISLCTSDSKPEAQIPVHSSAIVKPKHQPHNIIGIDDITGEPIYGEF